MQETIIKVKGKFRLVSKSGKNLGEYDTEEEALEREKQVQYFKHKKMKESEKDITFRDLDIVDPTDDSWDDELGILAHQYMKRRTRDVEEERLPKFVVYKSIKTKKLRKEKPVSTKKKNGQLVYVMPSGAIVYHSDAEEIIENTDPDLYEALTMIQRIKRRASMRKAKHAIARGRKRAMRKPPTQAIMKKRALKAARNLLFKKYANKKPKAELGFAERSRIEKILAKKKGAIKKIARKLLPKMIRKEKEKRVKKAQEKT